MSYEMTENKVLLVGATGYIGGTVLDEVLSRTESSLQGLTFDLLVRQESQARILNEYYGERVKTIIWKGLEDVDSIVEIAANYDIIVNTGSGFSAPGARAFVDGLSRRLGKSKAVPWLFHIAGCTNIADRPISDKAYPDRVWDDAYGKAIYEYMKDEDEKSPYPQRTAEVGVLTEGERTGVQVISVNIPCVFGKGTGLFNTQGIMLPVTTRYVVEHGYGYKLNETGNFDWVHVRDLADLYVLLLRTILEREDRGVGFLPSGHKGIIFPAVGRALHTEIVQMALDTAFDAGILPRSDTPQDKEIRLMDVQELADQIMAGFVQVTEQGVAGHKSMKGTISRTLLGWKPTRLDEAWRQDFKDELGAFLEGKRGVTTANCMSAEKR
ncbi:hypothetical protein HJFPF1_13409 [Paramyrothecium foliicola]|nr:hypothetical protein HJFPF1_13409 [Paramyrothecium foliicola]